MKKIIFLISIFTLSLNAQNVATFRHKCCTTVPLPPINQDKIAAGLSTSLDAYNAAANGTWVEVTEAEYTAIQTSVAGSVKAGQVDNAALYTNPVDFGDMGYGYTATTTTAAEAAGVTKAVPDASWVYAFQFKTGTATTNRKTYLQLGTKGTTGGFATVLPVITYTNTVGQLKSYVYKGGIFSTTTKDIAALGGSVSIANLANHSTRYSGNAGPNSVNINTSTHPLDGGIQSSFIQVLTTPTKQW